MNWQTLLYKIGLSDPPAPDGLTPLVREATDRAGHVDRRVFLKLCAGTAGTLIAATTFDPERLLHLPGAKTLFVPETRLLTATTMEEALNGSLVAMYEGGWRREIKIASADQLAGYVREIEAHGGRIVRRPSVREIGV